jgi:hypothetical protein
MNNTPQIIKLNLSSLLTGTATDNTTSAEPAASSTLSALLYNKTDYSGGASVIGKTTQFARATAQRGVQDIRTFAQEEALRQINKVLKKNTQIRSIICAQDYDYSTTSPSSPSSPTGVRQSITPPQSPNGTRKSSTSLPRMQNSSGAYNSSMGPQSPSVVRKSLPPTSPPRAQSQLGTYKSPMSPQSPSGARKSLIPTSPPRTQSQLGTYKSPMSPQSPSGARKSLTSTSSQQKNTNMVGISSKRGNSPSAKPASSQPKKFIGGPNVSSLSDTSPEQNSYAQSMGSLSRSKSPIVRPSSRSAIIQPNQDRVKELEKQVRIKELEKQVRIIEDKLKIVKGQLNEIK